MLLRTVRLYLHSDEFAQAARSEFLFSSCYVSNFLSRRVRDLGFRSDGFKGVLIQGRCEADGPVRISSEGNVIVPVHFDQPRYESLGTGGKHEFFIGMVVEGLEKCARHHRIPFVDLMAAIDEFRRGGYRNEWTYQKKLLRPFGIQASLLCRLDAQKFALTLKLERKGTTLFEQEILETKPDEVVFAHRFKEVVAEEDRVVVKDKFGKPIFSTRVDSLG
jgi:hypothetical protein